MSLGEPGGRLNPRVLRAFATVSISTLPLGERRASSRTSSTTSSCGAVCAPASPSGTAAGVAGRPGSLVLAVSDALRGEVYAGAFRLGERSVVTELEPRVWRPDSLVALGLGPDVLVGEVPAAAGEVLERATGLAMITPPEGAPRAPALIALAGLESGAREVPDVSAWEPFYGRPAEAQARWEIAHGRPLPDPTGGAR